MQRSIKEIVLELGVFDTLGVIGVMRFCKKTGNIGSLFGVISMYSKYDSIFPCYLVTYKNIKRST